MQSDALRIWLRATLPRLLSERRLIWAFGVLYVVGIGWYWTLGAAIIGQLTVVMLLITILALWYHQPGHRAWHGFLFGAGVIGFGAELIGVNTGVLFGDYEYGGLLGPKLLGTPLFLGLMWWLVTYLVWRQCAPLLAHWWQRIVLLPLAVVWYDIILEPFAIRTGLWSWAGGEVPLLNYVTWYGVAVLIYIVAWRVKLPATHSSKLVTAALISQTLFMLLVGTVLPLR